MLIMLALLSILSCNDLSFKSTEMEDYFANKKNAKEESDEEIIKNIKESLKSYNSFQYIKGDIEKLSNTNIQINDTYLIELVLFEIDCRNEKDIELLKKVLNRGAGLMKVYEESPIFFLIKNHRRGISLTKVIKVLANSNLNLGIEDNNKYTFFFELLKRGKYEEIAALLKSGFNPNEKNSLGEVTFNKFLVWLEINYENINSDSGKLKNLIELLIEYNLNLSFKDSKREDALYIMKNLGNKFKEKMYHYLINFYINTPSKYQDICRIYNTHSLMFSSFFALMYNKDYINKSEIIETRSEMIEKALRCEIDRQYIKDLKIFIHDSIQFPNENSTE